MQMKVEKMGSRINRLKKSWSVTGLTYLVWWRKEGFLGWDSKILWERKVGAKREDLACGHMWHFLNTGLFMNVDVTWVWPLLLTQEAACEIDNSPQRTKSNHFIVPVTLVTCLPGLLVPVEVMGTRNPDTLIWSWRNITPMKVRMRCSCPSLYLFLPCTIS